MKIGKLWALVLAAGLWACVDESYDNGPVGNAVDAGTISFLSDPMQMQRVTSRASDGKNDDEKRINTLHVFFFDENGEYLEGTYLVWMDCRILRKSSDELEQLLLTENKLWLNAGTMYGEEGEGFMRWNIACPRATLKVGLERFTDFVHKLR